MHNPYPVFPDEIIDAIIILRVKANDEIPSPFTQVDTMRLATVSKRALSIVRSTLESDEEQLRTQRQKLSGIHRECDSIMGKDRPISYYTIFSTRCGFESKYFNCVNCVNVEEPVHYELARCYAVYALVKTARKCLDRLAVYPEIGASAAWSRPDFFERPKADDAYYNAEEPESDVETWSESEALKLVTGEDGDDESDSMGFGS